MQKKRRGPWEDGPRLATDVAISGEGLRDDQSSLIQRRIRDGREEHERCDDEGKLFILLTSELTGCFRVDYEMPLKLSADAAPANFFALISPKQKARRPSSAPSFLTVAGGWAGLGDDLGSLRKDRDGDRSKQGEGGGDRSNLGHFISLSVSNSVDYEMPAPRRSDAA